MPADIQIYRPDALGPPPGQYTHVTRVNASEFQFIAGILSGGKDGNIIGTGGFDAQCTQVFTNYMVDSQSIADSVAFRRREFPMIFPNGKYPPNTLLVDRLV